RARALVDKGLESVDLSGLKDRGLYAVGGIWRSFARVDMEETGYPLHVLQEYEIPRRRALRLCGALSCLSRRSVEMMKVVSKRRAESLPYGAIVLERLLEACDLRAVVVSAYGLREGLLYARLPAEERAADPLIEFAQAMNGRMARTPAHAAQMFDWMTPLFADESAEMRRARRAVCFFADIAWRRHPDDRASGAFNQVLTAPFAGADHHLRAMIATAVFHRYSGDEDFPREIADSDLLDHDDAEKARRVGLACRLAFHLTASAPDALRHYPLRTTPAKL